MTKIVSSLGFSKEYLEDLVKNKKLLDYVLEFSSAGFTHTEENWILFLKYCGDKIIHNYFPGYSKPFVLNISSLNDEVYQASLNHCRKCIQNTAKYSSHKFYGVHAGFCLDIEPEHLGGKIPPVNMDEFIEYRQRFLAAIKELLDYARSMSVSIYLENNVLTKENYFGTGLPFFMIDADGIVDIMNEFKDVDNIGLLFDTAHFKVSCKTLELDPVTEFNKIEPYIKAIHHSDNDGLKDSNGYLNEDYWFRNLMNNRLKNLPNTIEVKNLNTEIINNSFEILGI